MARRGAIGFLLQYAMTCLALLTFTFHLLPVGLKICQEASGSIVLEADIASCCGDALEIGTDAAASHGCQSCVDFEISSEREATTQTRDFKAVTGPVDALPVIAIIDWPRPVSARQVLALRPARSPVHQAQIASIVIRC